MYRHKLPEPEYRVMSTAMAYDYEKKLNLIDPLSVLEFDRRQDARWAQFDATPTAAAVRSLFTS